MMKMFVQYHQEALKSLKNNVTLAKLRSMQVISKMLRSKFAIKNEELPKLEAIIQEMFAEFAALSGVKQELKIAE